MTVLFLTKTAQNEIRDSNIALHRYSDENFVEVEVSNSIRLDLFYSCKHDNSFIAHSRHLFKELFKLSASNFSSQWQCIA